MVVEDKIDSHNVKSVTFVSQDSADELVTNYIDEVRPLCTVEKPAFRALVPGFSPSSTVMGRTTMSKKLAEEYDTHLLNIHQQLVTAASIWFEIWGVMDPGKQNFDFFPSKFSRKFNFFRRFHKTFRFFQANF